MTTPVRSPRRRLLVPLAALALAVALLPAAAACSDDDAAPSAGTDASVPAVEAGTAVTLTPEQGRELLASDPDVVLVDVRSPEEYGSGHIEGAVNLDLEGGAFAAELPDLDPGTTYVVYCQSGRRSEMAADQMVAAGFDAVYDLGGIQAWTASGLPVVT